MNFKINNRMKLWLVMLALAFAATSFFNEPEQSTNVVAATTDADRHAGGKSRSARDPGQAIALDELHRPRAVADTSDLFRTVPVAPPLPFTFMGKVVKDGKLTFFISDNERVYLVHGGETIANNYHVDGIENGRLAFTYLPMKQKQYIELSGGQ